MMKKFSKFSVSVCCYLLLATPVFAQSGSIGCPTRPEFCDVPSIISTLSAFVAPIAVFLFLMMIIYGGFTKMTAAGNVEKEEKAMKILQAGIIGFVIIVLAPLIVNIITTLLGAETQITGN